MLVLPVHEAAIMNWVGKTTAIKRRIGENYVARIFDHKLTAEDKAFPKPLRGLAA